MFRLHEKQSNHRIGLKSRNSPHTNISMKVNIDARKARSFFWKYSQLSVIAVEKIMPWFQAFADFFMFFFFCHFRMTKKGR